MPEHSVMAYIRSRSASLVETYESLSFQISTKEAEISQLRLVYQDCTAVSSETSYIEVTQ